MSWICISWIWWYWRIVWEIWWCRNLLIIWELLEIRLGITKLTCHLRIQLWNTHSHLELLINQCLVHLHNHIKLLLNLFLITLSLNLNWLELRELNHRKRIWWSLLIKRIWNRCLVEHWCKGLLIWKGLSIGHRWDLRRHLIYGLLRILKLRSCHEIMLLFQIQIFNVLSIPLWSLIILLIV